MKSAYFAGMAVVILGMLLLLALLLLADIEPPLWAYGIIAALALLVGWLSYDDPDKPENYAAGWADWLP